jgi:hypothetical protein
MKKVIKFFLVMISAAVLFTACSNEDNPLDPNDPGTGNGDPEIQIPKSLKIDSIVLWQFPTTKPNGDKWDYSVFPNSPTRRPDIYVDLTKSGNNSPVFTSDIREDAELENAYSYFAFNQPQTSNSGSLPYNVPINETYDVNVWDDDGLSADDWMGSVSISPGVEYKNDNATHLYKTITSGGIKIEIQGRWLY